MKWNSLSSTRTWLFLFGVFAHGCGADNSCSSLGGKESRPMCGESTGLVTRILDGDTVELKDGRKIRYLHIDTPEISRSEAKEDDCFGQEARWLNELLVLNKVVDLEYDLNCFDRYGRVLAFVTVKNRMVNKILIERGYGKLMIIKPNNKYEKEFRILEEQAEANEAGIWGKCP